MKWDPIRTVWGKELRDTVRDRRTLLVMVIMPVVITPLLIVGSGFLVKSQTDAAKKATKKCILLGVEKLPPLDQEVRALPKFEFVPCADEKEAEEKVRQAEVHVALVVPPEAAGQLAKGGQATVTLYFKGTAIQSLSAMTVVSQKVDEYAKSVLKGRLAAKAISDTALDPVKTDTKNVAQKEMGGFLLGFIVPMMVVVWSIVGGMYTAMDVSAGEKERNTLEALLLTPTSRLEVTLGKLGAVSTVGFFTMVAALGSMSLAFAWAPMPAPAGPGAGPEAHEGVKLALSPMATLLMLGLSMLLVIAFSSLMLGIGVYARSVKEAQSLISPLYFFVLLPIMATSFIETDNPSLSLYLIPVVNAVLLFKELLKNQFVTAHILTTAAGLGACVLISIGFTLSNFRRETVLFKS